MRAISVTGSTGEIVQASFLPFGKRKCVLDVLPENLFLGDVQQLMAQVGSGR